MTYPPPQRVIGISELAVSAEPGERLITYALGSCIGVTFWEPELRIGGMLHAMMPISSADPDRAARQPAMFTDTAVTELLTRIYERGARKRALVAKVAGGATQVDQHGMFRIGERNLAVVRRVLWKNDILIAAQDVGGATSRTLTLDTATGQTFVKSNGSIYEL